MEGKENTVAHPGVKARSVFLVNFDWRDVFRDKPDSLREKLARDHLEAERNSFFFFSWAHTSYEAQVGTWRTKHVHTHGLEHLRPLLNALALILVPWTAYRKKERPDVWLTYDFGMVPALWLCKKLFGGALVFILNNQPKVYSQTRRFGRIKGWYSAVMERVGAPFVDHFMTINATLTTYLMGLGVPRERISVFSVNTIVQDKAYIEKAQKGRVRAQYHIPERTKILLSVARLEAEKNWPRTLELFATLPHTYVLFCLGEGSLRGVLEAKAKELGIAERVYFPGNIPRAAIWDYYLDADVFQLFSTAEALGIVFWEAMYVHTPTIGSAVDGIMESIGEDGDRGRIWRETDGPEGYAERVRFCTTPSAEREAMLARAKAYVDIQVQNDLTLNTLPIFS